MAIQQVDVGNALLKATQIQRLQNENEQNALAMERRRRFQGLAPDIAKGDEAATRQGLLIDPKSTAQMVQTINSLDEVKRTQAKENLELLANAATAADTPEEWSAMIDTLQQHTGTQDFEKYRGAFGQRETIISMLKGAAEQVDAPTVKTFYDKDTGREYKAQWNPQAQKWERVGGMKAADGDGSGGLTVAQQRTNAEIDQARETLKREGLTHEEILRIAKSQRDTGRANPDYNPFINAMVRQATERKYGDDPEFSRVYGQFLTPPPAGASVPPPVGTNLEPPANVGAIPSPPQGGGPLPTPPGTAPAQPAQPAVAPPAQAQPAQPAPAVPAPTGAVTVPTGDPNIPERPVATMSIEDIDAVLNGPQSSALTPAQLAAIDERLKALGF